MIELLRTKLFIPRPRKNLVARLHLVDCLNEGLDEKLTLIAAPARFGKTTLISESVSQSPHYVTWLSLDAIKGEFHISSSNLKLSGAR